MKVDKSLQEVWDWKDEVYRETKHLSVREASKKIHEDVKQIKKKYGLNLKKSELRIVSSAFTVDNILE